MTTVATIDATGITIPSYDEILAELVDRFKVLFGFDVYIEPDSQDLQMLAIFASAVHDANMMAEAVYNAFSPSTAQGVGLSSVVKINGLRRRMASHSSVTVSLIGQAGTTIENGAVMSQQTDVWLLPAVVTIPSSGEITVGATARDAGAITAAIGTIDHIVTSVPGWQEVTNPTAATAGAPVESDAELRRRQTQSTALAANSPVAAIWAGLLNLDGVERVHIYENDKDVPDGNGIPPHSIAAVIEGGDPTEIAETIAWTKTPGCGTYGTTTVIVYDPYGIPNTINYFVLFEVPVFFQITLQPLAGFLASIVELITTTMVEYFNSLGIGEKIYHNRLWAPANLSGVAAVTATGMPQAELDKLSITYNVVEIKVSMSDDPLGFRSTDMAIPFNAAAISSQDMGHILLPAPAPSYIESAAPAAAPAITFGVRPRQPRRRR